jgi:NAD-dependent dihydropyrimidine dehydrogenase PreA subunit
MEDEPMIRKIIKIDEDKCNGCGACAAACHEHAIIMQDGKAKLIKDDYCDGLGDCLPVCPVDAIGFEEREAAAYDAKAVEEHKQAHNILPCGCHGSAEKTFSHPHKHKHSQHTSSECSEHTHAEHAHNHCNCSEGHPEDEENPSGSELMQWPVQIKLVSIQASYFEDCDLLVSADCCAYAYGRFHQDFIQDHITVIGCPKLDAIDYSEKLTEIFRLNTIRSITLTRMEVPCCGGLENAVKKAIAASGKDIPLRIVTIAADGKILNER